MNDKSIEIVEAMPKRERAVAVSGDANTALLQVIANAARDPAVDIDKMQQLMNMHERLQAKAAEIAFNEALAEAQAKMRPVAADAENPQTRSRYATYAKLDCAIRPIYTAAGFSLSFDEGDTPKPDHIRVLCYVARGGYTRTYKKDIAADGKGAKGGDVMTKTHASGAAGSYGMRYLLRMIFNIAIGEDDNDGNDEYTRVSDEQAANIQALIEEVGANKVAFLRYLKVDRIDQIAADAYRDVVRLLEAKRKK